jgi:hypothetical protein
MIRIRLASTQLAPKDAIFQASYRAAVGIVVPPPMASTAAASISESTTRANPDNPQLALDSAILALRQNRSEAAVELATMAVNRHANSALLWRTLGMARYLRRGRGLS